MGIAGISPGSLFLILFIALLVFGPKRLQTISEELAVIIKQFRKSLAEEDGA